MIIDEIKKIQKYSEPVNTTQFHKKSYVDGQIDYFIGLTSPDVKEIVKKHANNISDSELHYLLTNKIHEYRWIALELLAERMNTKDIAKQKEVVSLYLDNLRFVNNWDLVDLTAHRIIGKYLFEIQDYSLLYEMSESDDLWIKRISIVSTKYLIKHDIIEVTLDITDKLMSETHDLLLKACGWMLREVGKKNFDALTNYIYTNYTEMPRTMLRYAIEKYPEHIRKAILRGDFSWM